MPLSYGVQGVPMEQKLSGSRNHALRHFDFEKLGEVRPAGWGWGMGNGDGRRGMGEALSHCVEMYPF